MMMGGRNSRYPFTASQWQELEHQALIFKYMASGTPIPHDLIVPIRRSFFLDSTSTSATQLLPHQPNIGWGCIQMGFGRKAEDPEPGRCRRTDGKKWRCSKEAYPDSKYCERHMHRGKNRSRKPVEMSITTNSTAAAAAATNNTTTTNNNSNSPYPSSLYPPQISMAVSEPHHHLMYPFPSSSRHPGIGFHPQSNTSHFHLDTGSSSSSADNYRYCHGLKEDVDHYTFFSEASGAERDGSWRFTPLGMSSLGEPKQRSCSVLQQQGSYFTATDLPPKEEDEEEEQRKQHHQHCFVLGADFNLERPAKAERKEEEEEEESHKPLRHFFDEWPPLKSSKESWMDSSAEESNWGAFPKTQLSISIPMAHHDFPIASSRSRNGN